ncbi:MAG: 23S rRNA (pseudouridine(1915)-N(3))-methyltransferase RlmH [Muribaculaceae bacterium]|nr:23S rRNA (pseudouridine(1915)-N(3))-methyltransferase RlmH [Muribaculaceae bacterium]
MKIRLICIGRNRNTHLENLISNYSGRIPHYMPFELVVIPDVKAGKSIDSERQKVMEGNMLLQQIGAGDKLILFDERGKELSSREFSEYIARQSHLVSRNLTFVIGGPYGFSQEVYQRADGKLSLSRMTFSHEMVRLFAVEQIYRAMTILRGEPYHPD